MNMTPITLPIAELKPALMGLSKVVNSRSALPVLKHVKVERTSEGWIALTGTDLDRFVTMRLEHPAEGPPVAVLVPYDQLLQLSKSCSRDECVHVEAYPDGPVIKFALGDRAGESKVKMIPVDEFPETPRIKTESTPLPPDCRRAIHEAMQCVSSDATRGIINNTFIDVSDPKANYIVGTDGKHLYGANSFALPLKESVVIPKHKFLGWPEFHKDGEWQLKADPDNVQISTRRWRFIAKQPEGKYPDWRVVIPDARNTKTRITFEPANLDRLTRLIERLPCCGRDTLPVGIEWEQDQVFLLAKADSDETWQRIPVADVKAEGPETGVFLDRRFFIQALSFGLNTLDVIDDISAMRFSSGGKQLIVMPVIPSVDRVAKSKTAVEQERPEDTPPPPPAQPPRKRVAAIIETSKPSGPEQPQTSIDQTIENALQVRDVLLDASEKIRGLVINLRHIQRDHKEKAKGFDSVRNRLRSLQGLKL